MKFFQLNKSFRKLLQKKFLKEKNLRNEINSTKKYLNSILYNSKLLVTDKIKLLKENAASYAEKGFNIWVTGVIIKYAITQRTALSYGLLSFMLMYYIKWLAKIIRKIIHVDERFDEDGTPS